ncbi:MAG: hypothetical protein JWQ49_292 [Edaphobacter sp.]|nr:hypothetical protein [Edaphobacter sp.]
MNQLPQVWWHEEDLGLGLMNLLSRSISTFEARSSERLPELRNEKDLVMATDFAGLHSAAQYRVTSFLLANPDALLRWNDARVHLRTAYGLGSRRMAFKSLNDRVRQRALPAYLTLANDLHGLLFTVSVSSSIQSLFSNTGRISRDTLQSTPLEVWKSDTAERALQTIHLASLLVRGLAAARQNVYWFIDEDDIVANDERHAQFVEAFGTVCGHYLTKEMGHFRLATMRSDTGSRDLEDLVAICDLAAGSIQEMLREFVTSGYSLNPETSIRASSSHSPKVQQLLNWVSDERHPLKRLHIVIDEDSETRRLKVTTLRMAGSTSAC